MWVRVLRGVRGKGRDLKEGQEVELDDEEARLLLSIAAVELIEKPARRSVSRKK